MSAAAVARLCAIETLTTRTGAVNFSRAVDRQELWPTDPRCWGHVAAKLAGTQAVFAPLSEEPPLGIKHLHATVDLVSNVDPTLRRDVDTAGVLELAITAAGAAPPM